VSSLAGPVNRPQRRTITIPLPRIAGNGTLAAGIAVAIAAASFAAAGGLRLERTTNVLIAMMLAGAALVIAALLQRPWTANAPLYGGGPLLAFAVLAGVTGLSVVWSLAPDDSWMEANRTFAYLALFAGGIAFARLAPQRWPALLVGVGLGCLLVCGWALLTKVFPASLAPDEPYARLREPFAYWNSVGLMAALGVPPMLWLAARRTGHAAVNALAWPAIGLLLVCMMLAYSRGSLFALVVALAAWFVLVPLRLRGLVALAGGVLAAGPVVAWAFAQDGLTTDRAPIAARVDAGHEFGALLLLMAAVLLAAGIAVQFAAAQRPPTPRERRLAGRAALAVLALVPVIALLGLSAAEGGVSGQVSKAWDQLTDPNAKPPGNTPDRLTATSSVRARYWREALDIHATDPWIGAGAGAYATVRTRFRTDIVQVRHAHGYVVQTLADLGWAGLIASLLAAGAWLLAAARATGVRRADRGLPYDAERIGMLTLVVVVLVFAVHSLIDWTWFVPANAGVAVLCAGWVAGRGPLRARLEHPEGPTRPAAPPWPHASRLARIGQRLPPLRALAVLVVLAIALAAAWTAYQPVRAVHAGDAAFERLDQGQPEAAAASARTATERNPLSVDPLYELAAIEEARGRAQEAEAVLERAVALQPANAEAWRRLGRVRLTALNDAKGALSAYRAAYYLDPRNPASTSDVIEASRAVATGGAPTP
jgi:cytochrome c-type biogenesis protein CcmH/NrfG